MANKNIKGLTVEIGGNTTKLGEALDKSKNKSKDLQKELRDVNKLLKGDPQSVELLAQKEELLKQRVGETKTQLDLLKGKQEEVQKLFEKGDIGEEDYRAYQREIERTRQTLDGLQDDLDKTSQKISETTAHANGMDMSQAEGKVGSLKDKFADMAEKSAEKLQGLSDKMKSVGDGLKTAGKGIMPASAAAAGVLAGSVASYKDLDTGYDTIVKKTGATDEAFDSLKKTADELFSSSTFDMTDIGNAIGEVNTRFGYTDSILKSVSEEYLQFAKINDADVSDSVSKSAQIMKVWNLSSDKLPDLLGMITAKGQETGVAVGDLMSKVLDNNATLKEMGLSLEESISLMAQFEQNGINDGTALAAMKTAVKNSVKEGKSLSEVLSENVSDIKNASTETEALQIATSLFGSKGAAEMANAIRDGRLSFDDLSGSMDSYKDTVGKTYKATLDPLEESKTVLNNLKLAGADLAATALKEGKPLIDDVTGAIKGLTEWFKKLNPEQKQLILKAIELVAVAGPGLTIAGKITKNIGNVVGLIPKLITKLVAQTSATAAATGAQEGLNVAMNSNAAGAVIAAITGIIAVAGLLIAANNESADSFDNLKLKGGESLGELHKKLDEEKEKWDDIKKARQDSLGDVASEFGHLEEYRDRLSEIVDNQGKIKDGHEEEAEIITTTLSQALDKDIEIHDGVILKYKELQGEIDKTIALKKAEAMQSAYSESYEEAVKNKTQSWQNWQDTLEAVEAKEQKLTELEQEKEKIKKRYGGRDTIQGESVSPVIDQQIARVQRELEQEKQNAKDFEQIYRDSLNAIDNYEKATAAIANGNEKELSDATGRLRYNFQTAENSTRESLEQQVADLQKNYLRMKDVVGKEGSGVTQTMVDEAERMHTLAVLELQKFNESTKKELDDTSKTAKEGGKKIADKTVEGMTESFKEARSKLSEEAGKLVDSGFVSMSKVAQVNSPSKRAAALGQNIGHTFADNIGGQADYAEDESRRLAQAAFDALNGLPDAGAAQSWALRTHGFASAGAGAGSDYNSVLNKIARAISVIERNAQTDVRLNDGTLVGSTVGKYDAALAVRAKRKHRGW